MNYIYSIYGKKVEYSLHKKFDLCYRLPISSYHKFLLDNFPELFENQSIIGNYINFIVPDKIKEYCYSIISEDRYIPYIKIKSKVLVDGCNPNPYGIVHFGNIIATHYGFIYSNLLRCKYSDVKYAYYVNDFSNRKLGEYKVWIDKYINHFNNHTLPNIFIYQSKVLLNYSKCLFDKPFIQEVNDVYIDRINQNSQFIKRYIIKDRKPTYLGSDISLMMYLTSRKYNSYYLVTGKDHKGYLDEIVDIKHPLIDLKISGLNTPIINSQNGKYSKRQSIHPITIENFNTYIQNIYMFNITCISIYGDKDRLDTDIIDTYNKFNSIKLKYCFKSFFQFLNIIHISIEKESLVYLTKYFNNPLFTRDIWVEYLVKKYLCL